MMRLALGTGMHSSPSAVDAAWATGIRAFDTAPFYRLGGSEEVLGQALAARPRDEYTLTTKVGRVLRGDEAVFDFSPDGIRASFAGSLQRLGVDRVDALLLHDPENHMEEAPRAVEVARELAPTVGVGTNYVAVARELVERGEVDLVLLAGRYTLLDRSAADELLPLCLERGVPVLAAGVFNSGVLAGGTSFDYRAAPVEVLERRQLLSDVCGRYGVPLPAAAIQFPLRHPAVASVVIGARSADEIEEDVRLLAVEIPDELWAELECVSPLSRR
jgi:D-threo-aldose 1-dehydrogenase